MLVDAAARPSSSSSSSSATHCYLSAIYPAADIPRIDDATARSLIRSLRVLYLHLLHECGGMRDLGVAGNLKPLCRSQQADLVTADTLLFADLWKDCTTPPVCELRAAQYLPKWAEGISRTDNWIEVHRFAFAGKAGSRRPQSWREYLDGGLSGWWYYRAPGSGIFYRTGVTRVAPTKPAMIALLVREWTTSTTLRSSSFLINTLHTLFGSNSTLDEAADQFERLQSDRIGDPKHPWNYHHLSDLWDVLLIRLGRALGYETLVFTTEIDSLRHYVSSTLVDLRNPFSSEYFNRRVDLVERSPKSPSLVVPEGVAQLDEATAKAWAEHVQHNYICLRDPTSEAKRRCTRPCDFTSELTVRLSCPGHVSWSVRNESLPSFENRHAPGCYKF